ncbi:GNAT family N-acetyltransferase [Paenibacillus sp. FSL R7-0297]|uniref:GNAT family N-acetyltransferase n=1 Tax=unclassified Paenibacillus TaxID=185978 RepID=UPI00069419B7|nr:GNAT family N-acetyltransferase [Paenibacillus sp. FSL R5-0912]
MDDLGVFPMVQINPGGGDSVLILLRHQGYGRKLIGAAEQWIRKLGIQRSVITSQKQVVGFYESLGYTARPEINSADGVYISSAICAGEISG